MYLTSLVTGEDFLKQRSIASASVSSISFNTRLEFWRKGLEYLWDTNGFGCGIGGFAKLVDPWPAAHSIYFSALFDLGVIGFLLLSWLFIKLVLFMVRSLRTCTDEEIRFTAKCLMAYLIIVLVHGLVDFDYVYFPAWVVVSLLVATLHIGSTPAGHGDTAEHAGMLPARHEP